MQPRGTREQQQGLSKVPVLVRFPLSAHADFWADDDLIVESYTFSRQRQDERIERRGELRSAVLVSAYPYTSVLLPLASVLGPNLLMSFTVLAPQLLSDSANVWAAPRPGKLVRLNVGPQHISGFIPLDEFLPDAVPDCTQTTEAASLSRSWSSLKRRDSLLASQSSLSASIPAVGSSSNGGSSSSDNGISLAPQAGLFADFDLEVFNDQIHSLWALWEVLITGSPLLVYARTPKTCTSAVAALLSLVTPLPYQADFRPLLSIHDPQIQDVMGGRLHTTEHPVPTVWGATNPFFLRTRIPDLSIVVVTSSPASNSAMGTSGSLKRSTSQSNTTLLPTVLATARAFSALLSSSVDALPADFLDGTRGGICLSQPSLCGGPDKATLAKLDSIQRTDHNRSSPRQTTTTSNVLRAHFYALTCAFLAPFCKFCGISPPWDAGAQKKQVLEAGTLHPLQTDKDVPQIKSGDFMKYLDEIGVDSAVLSYCKSPKAARELYDKFMHGSHFDGWIKRTMLSAGASMAASAPS